MNFNKKKFKFKSKINHSLYVIFLFILIFALISSVSSAEVDDTNLDTDNTLEITESNDSVQHEKNVLSAGSVYDIDSSLTNDEIQAVFDKSKSGDTIQFNEKQYNNISIVVEKKLNIVSKKNSKIYSSSSIPDKANRMGIANSFAFYFTELASGSTLKGLTIVGNSDYDIIVEKGSNISIVNNTVSGGKKAGILLNNSKYLNIKSNTVMNNYDGIILNNLNRSNFTKNRIISNEHNGLFIKGAVLNNITYNNISKNGLDGVHLEDAKVNNISKNNITYNGVSGLRLEGYTTRNKIMSNNISSNSVNIYANSYSTEDTITHNTLMYAKAGRGVYLTPDNVGCAILFGYSYDSNIYSKMNYEYNTVGFNDYWDAKAAIGRPPVEIGSNWYFDNDGNYALGHICPLVFGGALDAEEFKHLSMGFGGDENGLFGQLYEGDKPAGAGAFTVDNVNINGKDYGPIEVDEDGRFSVDIDEDLEPGSVITVTINGHSFNITVDKQVNSTKPKDSTEPSENTPINEESNSPIKEDNKKLPVKEGANPKSTGNGTGSGAGSSNGSGSGEGNFTGSGISVGDLSGQSNQGTSDSGDNGGGSASEGVSAYEILKEEKTPPTAKNSQLLAVFGVALVLLIIALGYRSKNKDDYDSKNKDFEI